MGTHTRRVLAILQLKRHSAAGFNTIKRMKRNASRKVYSFKNDLPPLPGIKNEKQKTDVFII